MRAGSFLDAFTGIRLAVRVRVRLRVRVRVRVC